MLKLITAAACLCATLAQARSSDLAGQQINEAVAGATVEIDTPTGDKLRVRYARDGKLAGDAPGLAWYLGSASDGGRWWVASDKLCHQWVRWLNAEPQCMRLSRAGSIIHWRSLDGYSGTATITMPAPVQAEAVPLTAQPSRSRQIALVEAPAGAAGTTRAQPPEPAAGDPPSSRQAATETAAPLVPPRPVPARAAPGKSPPPPQEAEARRTTAPTFRVAHVHSDDVLNVRSGPSADFEIVGVLPPGSRGIAITSLCQSRWCPVQHRGTRGWVNSAYLVPEAALSRVSLYEPLRDADTAVVRPVRDSAE
jgi:hypothetical protein